MDQFESQDVVGSERAPLSWPQQLAALVFGCAVVALVIFNISLLIGLSLAEDWQAAIVFGCIFAQMSLLGVWTALADCPIVRRIVLGTVGTMTVCLVFAGGLMRDDCPLEMALSIAGVGFGVWFVIQLPLIAMRWLGGWRLATRTRADLPQQGQTQFGIGQLMIWTLLVAMLFGAARLLATADSELSASVWIDIRSMIIQLSVLVLANSLFGLPIVWAAFVQRGILVWLLISMLCCSLITLVEMYAMQIAEPSSSDNWYAFVLLNGVQYGVTCTCFLPLRVLGVRFVRPE